MKHFSGAAKYDKDGRMTDEWFGFIDAANSFAGEFPDGAFMAFMEENGISVEDLEAYSMKCNEKRGSEK